MHVVSCPTRAKNLEWYLILGGRVESIIEKWETSQKMAKFTRNFARNQSSATGFSENGNNDGPPVWISFGKKVGKSRSVEPLPEADPNFKALPAKLPTVSGSGENSSNNNTTKEEAEFESERQNAIKEATAKSEKKVFGGGDGTKIKEGKREERRGGRGGRGRDNNRAANGHEGSEEPPQDNKGRVI
jgi:hypothetical protein